MPTFKRISAVVVLGVSLAAAHPTAYAAGARPDVGPVAKIYFIDIGQGASTLIVSPTGKTLLVDGGPGGQGSGKIVPLLNTLGISAIDFTVLTHYHIDHDAGLTEVFNAGKVPVGSIAYDVGDGASVIPPNTGSTMNAYLAYKTATTAFGAARQTITPGTVIDLGGGMRATCLAAAGNLLSGGSVPISNSDLNSESISLLVEYNNFDFIVSGDLTGGGSTSAANTPDVETWVAQLAGDVDVVELDHHGSTTASNRRFLGTLKAEVSVAEAGYTNTFGHPNRETTNKYLNTQVTNGNTYGGTGIPTAGVGPVTYQTDPSPAGDTRCSQQGYSGTTPANAGQGTILLQTDGTTSYSLMSFDDGGITLPAAAHTYFVDTAGAGVTTNFPPTVIPSINPVVPLSTDAVTVTAQVFDREDPIASVTLNYSLNGAAQTPVTMTLMGGGLYQATIPAQPDGTRVDVSVTGAAGAGSTVAAIGYFAGTTPISSLRALGPLGEPLYLDYAARVSAVCLSSTGRYAPGSNDDYVKDATGALNVFRTSQPSTPATQPMVEGNTYTIAGVVGNIAGKLRLEVSPPFNSMTTPYTIVMTAAGGAPVPTVMTIAQLNAGPESFEGQLISIANCTITSGTIPTAPATVDGFLTVDDGTGTFTLKIDHDTDIPGLATPMGTLTVIGTIQQDDPFRPFDASYNIAPRSRVDLGFPAGGPALMTIANARIDVDPSTMLPPGDYVPDLLGQQVRVRGVVTSIDFRGGNGVEYYIQDATGGIDFFNTTTNFGPYNLGDAVEVVGTIQQFNGLTEINPGTTLSNVTLLAPGTLPPVSPQVVTLAQIGNAGAGEAYEGELIRIEGVTLMSPPATFVGNANYVITDASGTGTMRIDSDTDIDGNAPPASPFTLIGVLGQFDSSSPFDSGYQVLPYAFVASCLGDTTLPGVTAPADATVTQTLCQ